MKGAGTNEHTLFEIIASHTPGQIVSIKKKYKEKFNRYLEEDVKKHYYLFKLKFEDQVIDYQTKNTSIYELLINKTDNKKVECKN